MKIWYLKKIMMHFFLIACGGASGALVRFLAYLIVEKHFGCETAWATIIVNIAGSFLIGLFLGGHLEKGFFSNEARLFFVVGFLGALTTFSTYSWETISFLKKLEFRHFAINILANNILCLIASFTGWKISS